MPCSEVGAEKNAIMQATSIGAPTSSHGRRRPNRLLVRSERWPSRGLSIASMTA